LKKRAPVRRGRCVCGQAWAQVGDMNVKVVEHGGAFLRWPAAVVKGQGR